MQDKSLRVILITESVGDLSRLPKTRATVTKNEINSLKTNKIGEPTRTKGHQSKTAFWLSPSAKERVQHFKMCAQIHFRLQWWLWQQIQSANTLPQGLI